MGPGNHDGFVIAVHLENGQVEVRQLPRPRRKPGHAAIRLLYGGICNTDLELRRGYYGFSGIPGHEFVGEVVEADTKSLVGKRVVGEINLPCKRCKLCKQGLGNHCPKRSVLGIVRYPGAFRELLTLPEDNLHVVPKGIPTEHAVFVEPVAAAWRIVEQVSVRRSMPVAVLGDGKLGLLVAQVLQARGARVHQFGHHRDKLDIAERAGVVGEVVPQGAPLPEAEYDLVVEATGSGAALEQAIRMTRPLGTVVLKSTTHGTTEWKAAPAVVNEIRLVGSRCGPFAPALKLLASGAIHVDPMITDSMRLDYAPLAFERAAHPPVLKVLLHPPF